MKTLQKIKLSEDDIHIWFTYDEDITDAALINQYMDVLSPEETLRQKRFGFARDRHQYLITRAMVRSVLSLYCPELRPHEWRFNKNKYGKPYVSSRLSEGGVINFNVSHTKKLIVLAISLHNEVGIDVECKQRQAETLDIADRFFSPAEVNALFALDKSRQNERFFHLWTLKEAYIKACGMGLSIPLDQFSFHFQQARTIEVTFDSRRADDPAQWRFWGIHPNEDHRVALALKKPSAPYQYTLKMQKIIPFAGYKSVAYPLVFSSN
ncbi:MAG: 4'-phosphopantetheinyl transferase [Cellvibrionaceae bacterium]|jgi:4'-phosphopantetheinyl transferase